MTRPDKSVQETHAPDNACFGCGPANTKGLRIRSFEEGDSLVLEWRAEKHHEAWEGVVNGGIIGVLFDCHSNWCTTMHLMRRRGAASPPPTVTASFAVTLKRPAPSTETLRVTARVVESTDDRATVEAVLEAGGSPRSTPRKGGGCKMTSDAAG
jgi:acyl-coenzyme A thioesterase PaaI-like protein